MHEIIKTDWADMKTAVSGNSLIWQYHETKTTYRIFANDGNVCVNFKMHKQEQKSTDQIDFETNIKSSAKKW